MRTLKKVAAIAFVCIFSIASVSMMADQAVEVKAEARYYCLITGCHAPLNKLNKYSECTTCGRSNYAYLCPNKYCGQSWAICPAGHYKALYPVG